MQPPRRSMEDLIDEIWDASLTRITKEGAGKVLRAHMGDDLDLFVPQSVTSSLLNAVPAFARLLYTSSYTSAKRNAYLVVRKLGMPADFFWKFDYWTQDHALETLGKTMRRIFTSLMAKQKEGELDLVGVDVERSRFRMTFGDCVECAGLSSTDPLCFFHGGLFAGILGALLDRELDAVEVECHSGQGGRCIYVIGRQEDRDLGDVLENRFSTLSLQLDLSARARATVEGTAVRGWGNTVDMGYYQLLLASALLSNLNLLTGASMAAGEDLARRMAPLILAGAADPQEAIARFYERLGRMEVEITRQDASVTVRAREAPEAMGLLQNADFWPFMAGELQGLLSAALQQPIRFQESRREGQELVLLFAP